MSGGSLGERHFGRHFSIAIANTLAVLFEKFREPGLGYTEMWRLERLPNLFAASKSSGIIPAGLMANEILEPRFFPCFRRFALFHKADRRIAP